MPTNALVIFVVDDDASVRKAIHRLLKSLLLPVRLFASAEEFLASTRKGARGCLLLDLRLPGMSGLQLLEHLARDQWKLPIVVITAHDDDPTRDAALRLGAMTVIHKPFDRKEFLTSVHAAVAEASCRKLKNSFG